MLTRAMAYRMLGTSLQTQRLGTMKNDIQVSVILPKIVAPWPSVAIIQPEIVALLKESLETVTVVNILESTKPSLSDDFWIFPLGTVQVPVLVWLSNCFAAPMDRPPSIFFFGGEGAKLGYHIWHFRKIFRPDDLWVVSCQAEKDLLDHWFPGNSRTVIVYYPVAKDFNLPSSNAERVAARKKFSLDQGEKYVLYAGRLSQQKNILELLDFLKMHKDLRLLVCGDIDSVGVPHLADSRREHLANRLLTEIGVNGLSSRVEFLPYQAQSELRQIMKACDYQISLSAHYGEDFGYSLAQGFSCGLKTVLTDWGGHRNWKALEGTGSVGFVELNWEGGVDVGKPLLSTLTTLPQMSPTADTLGQYRELVRSQFDALFAARDFPPKAVEVHQELAAFWDRQAKTQSAALFPSVEHKLFKTVVAAYQGRI